MLKFCAAYALRERRYWQKIQKSCDQISDTNLVSICPPTQCVGDSKFHLRTHKNNFESHPIQFFRFSKILFFLEIKFGIHQWGANMFGYENAFVAFQCFTLVLGSFNRPKISINWNFWHFSRPIFTFHVKDVHRWVIQIDMNF